MTQDSPAPARLPVAVMATVGIGIFMATIDGGIVNVAQPTLVQDFSSTVATVRWSVLAYMITMAALVLPSGILGDRVGKHKVYVAGFLVFTLASALCGAAPSLAVLIAARVAQACGAAFMSSLGMGIVTEAVSPQVRGKALGIMGSIVSMGIISGPMVGGIIIDHLSWRAAFYVNIPIGILGVAAALRYLPREGRKGGNGVGHFSLLKNREFTLGLAAAVLVFAVTSGTTYLWPFYLQDVLKDSPSLTGLLLGVSPLTVGLVSPFAGGLTDRRGTRVVVGSGLVIMALAFLAALHLNEGSPSWSFGLTMIPIGIGIGFFQAANNSGLMGAVARPQFGLASSLIALTRTAGFAAGTLAFSTLWSYRLPAHAVKSQATHASVVTLREGILLAASLCLISLIISVMRQKPRN